MVNSFVALKNSVAVAEDFIVLHALRRGCVKVIDPADID
jgi:hypothetical protein